MLTTINNFVFDDSGAVHTEYALLGVLISIAAVGAVTLFGESVYILWNYSYEAIIKIIYG